MISRTARSLLSFALAILICTAFAQGGKRSYYKDGVTYDVNGVPFLGDSMTYFTLKGDTIYPFLETTNIDFKGDREAFANFIDSCYFNNPDHEEIELNMLVSFFIIFNDSLDIEEVRILRPSYRLYDEQNLDEYFINCIKNKTDGRWIKGPQKQVWYIYGQTCRLH